MISHCRIWYVFSLSHIISCTALCQGKVVHLHLHMREYWVNQIHLHLWLSLLSSVPFPGDLRPKSIKPSLSGPCPRCLENQADSPLLWVIMEAAKAPWAPVVTAWCFPRWDGTRLGTGCGITPLEELRPGCRLRGLGAGNPGCSESLVLSRKTGIKKRNNHLINCLDLFQHLLALEFWQEWTR